MSLGINTPDGYPPYGVIDCYGLQLPNNILGNGLNLYHNIGEAVVGQSFASINSSGITSTGSLIIENINGGIAWEFKNGTIRNWNAYCDSEIKTNNVLDGGNGYSTIDLIAKKYSEGELADSISIGLDGSTKTVKVSDNANVQLPANTTIGGNTPATFGEDVDATFRNLTTYGPITVYGVEYALNVESVGPDYLPMLALTGPEGIKFNSPIYENIELYGFNAETEEYLGSVFKVDYSTLKYSGNKAILPLNTQIGSDGASVSFSGDENNGFIQLTAHAQHFALPGYSYRITNGIKLAHENENPEIGTSYIYLNDEMTGNVDIHAADSVNISSTNNIALSGNVTINGNTPAVFGDTVSGTLKDLTFTDGITINKNQLSAGGEYGSSIIFDDTTLNVAGYNSVYINGFGSGVKINSEGGKISLNTNNNKIVASARTGIELSSGQGVTITADTDNTYFNRGNTDAIISLEAPEVKISDTFVIPVYTTDESGNYTKVANETKTVRCVKQVLSDGTATYTLELA